jgi:hypothetical protein
MKQVVIIGAGIAGLYLSYRLLQMGYYVTLIEKEKELGGRMYTKKVTIDKQTFFIEGGAGVLRDDDDTTIGLLDELNIPINFWKGDTAVVYNDGTKSKILEYDYPEALSKLCQNSSNDKSFIDLLEKDNSISNEEKIGIVIGTTYSELFDTNSRDVCVNNDWSEFLFSGDDNEHEFGKPKGWFELTNRLEEEILKMNGKIIRNTAIVKINAPENNSLISRENKQTLARTSKRNSGIEKDYYSVETNRKEIYPYDILFITCPYHFFDKIKTPKSLQPWRNFMKQYHGEINYLRVYSYFDEPFIITKKIATNLGLRRVIPINDRLIMTVYTDGEDATYIDKLCKDENKLSEYIRNELQVLLERDIPKIQKNWCFFWYKGISYWKPSKYSVSQLVETARNPVPNIFFCGDTYSEHPGWLDGALDSCNDILEEYFIRKEEDDN